MVRTFAWAMLGALLVTLSGCGGDEQGASPAVSGSGGMPSASGAGGVASGGVAATGGSGGAAGGPLANSTCTGHFPAASQVFVEETMIAMNGLSVTADELELFYTRGERGTTEQILVARKRASVSQPFGAFEVLPGLEGACVSPQRVNSDISEDGLTLYITCTDDVSTSQSEGMSTLRAARRSSRAGVFTLDPVAVGSVQASSGISADELAAYSDGQIFGVEPPRMFTRQDKTQVFASGQAVPGIGTPLGSLDISSDSLVLFGAAARASGTGRGIFRATRSAPDATFGALEELELGLPGTLGSANITPRCSLYMIMALVDQAAGTTTYSAQLSKQE